jgi:hypothetical protein
VFSSNWRASLCVIAIGLAGLAVPAAAAAEEACNKTSAEVTSGEVVSPTVALQSSGTADPINMGALKGTGITDVTVSASPALPKSVTPGQITLDVPKRFTRNGTNLNTAYLPAPTFSTPRILEHGKLIAFSLCLDADNIDAGSYIGQVIVGGPEGVQPATVTVTLNAKDQTMFRVGIVLAVLVAFALLLMRGIKVNYDKTEGDTQGNFMNSLKATAKDVIGFWLPTVVAIGAAVIAMLTVYDGAPSWGADQTASLIALGGTAITAAGAGTFLSSLSNS